MHCLTCSAQNPDSAILCSSCGAVLDIGHNTSPDALPVNTTLLNGSYTIESVLGQGGFGITYAAHDIHCQRVVAIKEFFPPGSRRLACKVQPDDSLSTSDYENARAKFLDEARTLARFLAHRHRHIVEVLAAFAENNTAYMVMEYLRGHTLMKHLEERGTLPEREVMSYAGAISEALQVVHDSGLLHRDIKPENVMLCDDGRIVLLDFGAARIFSAGLAAHRKHMTAMLTPGYAPLEQYGQQQLFGAHTDIYAFGATLYHLLTGQMPTPATDRAAGVELMPPDYLNNNVTQPVSCAIMWAMQMRIPERPQTVRDFVAALPIPANGVITPLKPPAPVTLPALSQEPLKFLDGWFEVEVPDTGNPVQWPQKCACCGESSDTTLEVTLTYEFVSHDLTTLVIPEVPYCTTCAAHTNSIDKVTTKHIKAAFESGLLATFIMTLTFLITDKQESNSGLHLFYFLVGAFIIGVIYTLWPIVMALQKPIIELKPSCCQRETAVLYGGHQWGASVYRFKSEQYAHEFRQLNPFPASLPSASSTPPTP